MPKIKPEKVAGIVALAYLFVIPATGVFLYQRLKMAENETAEIWRYLDGRGSKPNLPENGEMDLSL